MFTLGTFIHEQGHVLAVKLTGGHLIGVEYELSEATTIYEGGNVAIIAICGPIFGTIGLLVFAKAIGCSQEWIVRALLINLAGSAHDFAYYALTQEIWFFMISVPCLVLVTKSMNNFWIDLYSTMDIEDTLVSHQEHVYLSLLQ